MNAVLDSIIADADSVAVQANVGIAGTCASIDQCWVGPLDLEWRRLERLELMPPLRANQQTTTIGSSSKIRVNCDTQQFLDLNAFICDVALDGLAFDLTLLGVP